MTLLSAIQAKLVTNRTRASAWAPDMPSARPRGHDRRHAQAGADRREDGGERRAADRADADDGERAPWPSVAGRLAPTCSVVATMFAPAKMRKRSNGRLGLLSGRDRAEIDRAHLSLAQVIRGVSDRRWPR